MDRSIFREYKGPVAAANPNPSSFFLLFSAANGRRGPWASYGVARRRLEPLRPERHRRSLCAACMRGVTCRSSAAGGPCARHSLLWWPWDVGKDLMAVRVVGRRSGSTDAVLMPRRCGRCSRGRCAAAGRWCGLAPSLHAIVAASCRHGSPVST